MKVNRLLLVILAFAFLLRVWGIDKVPVSLMFDELEIGYHAYSVLKTGRDYTGRLLPLQFKSVADMKSPLYIYASVPTVAAFGISPYGVRLPSVVFGTLAVWLMYLVGSELLRSSGPVALLPRPTSSATAGARRGPPSTRHPTMAILAAFLLAISPWHLQYSRGAFEANLMLTLYLAGIYFFFRALREGGFLVLSSLFLVLTVWAYATAKLFLPLTVLFILLLWWRDVLRIEKKFLVWSGAVLVVLGFPIFYTTVFGGGANRFNYTSVFADPTVSTDADYSREHDALFREGFGKVGLAPSFVDRFFHNKVESWIDRLTDNYVNNFSADFLFVKGDRNLRHSPKGIGQFYKIEALFLIIGLILFLVNKDFGGRLKIFLLLWILAAPLPAALTQDGAGHATRAMFLMPPLLFLVAWGILAVVQIKRLFLPIVVGLYLVSFVFYQHNYWVHYPWDSERAWHAGTEDAIKSAVVEGESYKKVVITQAAEPPLLMFLAWSAFDPAEFQKNYPLVEEEVAGFGKLQKLGKYYFGMPLSEVGVNGLGKVMDKDTIYLAAQREVDSLELARQPDKAPKGLDILRSITYPSGEPAFYLFAKE